MSLDEGSLACFIRDETGHWQDITVVDLKHYPEAILQIDEGTFLIVSNTALLTVTTAGKVTYLVSEAFWSYLYPFVPLATPNGDIYIGMRFGVVRVRKQSGEYNVKWLLPNQLFQAAQFDNLTGHD